ncbi:putative zinc finger CCCH domain-containing protein 9 isoform X1 [Brassica rapa]|uniref:putative zinc finger CCCH domain-containing protein 9 isoform X1 n=1 Tax=Brassica campestris TaxID=3711 RepID=UPI000872205A|nr:putative zinc finger CCCH domain-containing protein 9 isoform X1 [Brassica rapa]
MEETKERNMDLRSSKSDVRTHRRHKRDPRICAEKRDNKDSGLRINESHQTHDHKESYADIQRARDVEMQQQGRHGSESKNKVKRNSGYQVHPGERICPSYLQTGLCEHGSNCLFNHPTCKFFRRGFCKDGSDCKFIHAKNNEALRLPNTMRQPLSHPKDRDGADTMRQGSGRHETESAYRPEEKKYNDPQEQRDNTEWQRGEAQENVHEHRQRDITDCQRYYEMGRRDAQEIVVKQHRQRDITESLRYFEMGRRDAQVIVQQHRQREASGRQRYLEEEKSEEAQENDQEQRLMVTTLDGRFDERRHETESSSMAEKREELFTSLQSVFKDVIDDIAAGYERVGTEHGEGNVGRQRVEAEEIVQEQSNRDGDVL